MTTDDFIAMWPDMVKLRPKKVVFTGGEPLLRGVGIHRLAEPATAADRTNEIVIKFKWLYAFSKAT